MINTWKYRYVTMIWIWHKEYMHICICTSYNTHIIWIEINLKLIIVKQSEKALLCSNTKSISKYIFWQVFVWTFGLQRRQWDFYYYHMESLFYTYRLHGKEIYNLPSVFLSCLIWFSKLTLTHDQPSPYCELHHPYHNKGFHWRYRLFVTDRVDILIYISIVEPWSFIIIWWLFDSSFIWKRKVLKGTEILYVSRRCIKWLVILVIGIVDILNLKSNLNISELQGFYFLKSLVIKAIEVEFQHELEIQIVKNRLHIDYIIKAMFLLFYANYYTNWILKLTKENKLIILL